MEKSNGRLYTAEEKSEWKAGVELVQRMLHRGRGVEMMIKRVRDTENSFQKMIKGEWGRDRIGSV